MKYIVYLDAGHGDQTPGKRTPIFPSGPMKGKYMSERAFNHAVVLKMIEALKSYNIEVLYVSATGTPDVSLNTRTNTANAHYKKALSQYGSSNVKALFVSIHANACTGTWGNSQGIETFYYKGSSDSRKAADIIQKQLIAATGLVNRGIKTNDLHITRETIMTAVLCECGFMDNLKEANLLISDQYRATCASAIVKGILSYLGITYINKPIAATKSSNTKAAVSSQSKYYNQTNGSVTLARKLINVPCATISQCQQWAKSNGATSDFIANAKTYFKKGIELNIDPVFAYVQYGLESGYGKHQGVVPSSYHNPCGLKTKNGGSDNLAASHVCFKTWEDGISAHIDHIALYIGIKGYPKADSLDQRQFKELAGKGALLSTICKSWCPSNPKYAENIKNMMNQVCKTKTEITYEDAIIILYNKKIINTLSVWLDKPSIKYVTDLIAKAGKVLYSLNGYEEMIDYLVNQDMINTPDIWKRRSYKEQHVKDIIIKIANLSK